MPDYLTISKQNPTFPAYLDFQALRRIGIDHMQALSGQIWTDYNLHDPGVTILEVLCYTITDLGYRNNLDITDLLALNPTNSDSTETNFFTPDQVLTCNPVTVLDWRKRLIDIPGVRNAWLEKVETYEPAIYVDRLRGQLQYTPPVDQVLRLHPKGLYRVSLDLQPTPRKDACGQLDLTWTETQDQVKAVLCHYRNLCEDFLDVVVLGEEEIALCTDIELEVGADPEDVQVEIYVRVQEFLVPQLRFYSLQDLLAQGKKPAEIFSGRPSALYDARTIYASHGFINLDELTDLEPPKVLHTSDLYQIILEIPGVRAIKKLSIINYINGLRQSEGDAWCLYLTDQYRPVLSLAESRVTFFKGDLPFRTDPDEVERRYYEQQAASIKALRNRTELDSPIPGGIYGDLADHYSIHHDFPLTYGVGEEGLPETATPLRKAQARQLKGYLIFFDQVLANYLAQLANVRSLFSWSQPEGNSDPQHQRTYFTQTLSNVPDAEDVIQPVWSASNSPIAEWPESKSFTNYQSWLAAVREDPDTYGDRRNRFLDHLLARFAESFTDYVLLNYHMDGGRRDDRAIIHDKARFLEEYPALSRDRFRSFNYCDCQSGVAGLWDTDNVPGLQTRVSRLLGMTDARRRSLNHYRISENTFKLTIQWNGVPPLEVRQFDAKLENAQAHRDAILRQASNANSYHRLTYRFYYHYSWDVVDRQGQPLVTYNRAFPTPVERNAVLKPLVSALADVLDSITSTGSPPLSSLISVQPDDQNKYTFQLVIPLADAALTLGSSVEFTSILRYVNESEARAAAEQALHQITEQSAYQKIRLRRDDATERVAGTPKTFTYYGYGLVDDQGNLLAESRDRYPTIAQRDTVLQNFLHSLPGTQPTVEISNQPPLYTGRIEDATGQVLLQGTQLFETSEQAWAQGDTLVELILEQANFRLIDAESGNSIYRWELTNEGKDQIFGIPLQSFTTAKARDEAIASLQTRVNDEGFHLVEHLLLRPRHAPPEPVCSFAPNDQLWEGVNPANAIAFRANLVVQDNQAEYSFTVLDEQGDLLFSSQPFSTQGERDRAMELMLLSGLPPEATGQPPVDRYRTRRSRQRHSFTVIGDRNQTLGQSRSFTSLAELEEQKQWLQSNLHKFAAQVGLEREALRRWHEQQEPRDNYDLTQVSRSGQPEFERFLNPDRDRYYFHLNDCRGNVLFYSEAYRGRASRDRGVRSVIRNSILEEHYTLKKIPGSDRTLYFFTLRAGNGQEIGRSRYFDEFWKLEVCLDWFQHNVHRFAAEFGVNLDVPGRLIEPEAIADPFLPISKSPSLDSPPCTAASDPYSFWISVVLPYWPTRFREMNFRRLVERTLRLETPAHVALKICWVNVVQMHEFEEAYRDWLEQLHLDACRDGSCRFTAALNRLIDILSHLNNVYPEGTLHDCDESSSDDNPILLNQTALGTANK